MLICVPGEPFSQRTIRIFHTLRKYEVIIVAPLRERWDRGFREQVIGCLSRKVDGNRAGCQEVVGNEIGPVYWNESKVRGLGFRNKANPVSRIKISVQSWTSHTLTWC